MDENNHEEEPRERCKEALFVDDKSAELIQRVTAVMAVADELRTKDMIHGEKYDEIKAEKTNQEKMRRLFESLNSGGDNVKRHFYYFLEKHEPHLFKDLGGINRKRKQDEDFDDPVPSKRLKRSNNHYTHNYSKASPSAAEPVSTYIVNHIINQNVPPNNMDNVAIIKPVLMTSWTPASKEEKKLSAPNKQKKRSASKNVNKPPKKEKKSPAPKKDKPPAPKKEKKPPVLKKNKPPGTKKEKKPPAPKKKNNPPTSKKNKPPASKIENKTPAPQKDKPPVPKKEKKPPVPKKEKKPSAPKKEKSTAPKKEKKPTAPKKQKPPAPKKQKPPAPKKEKKPSAPKKQKPPAHK